MNLVDLFETTASYSVEDRRTVIDDYWDIVEKYIKNRTYIYRGVNTHSHLMVSDGSKMNRKSAATSNYYTLLINEFPEWSNFPARNKSFICSTTESGARIYGPAYVVIPLEGQQIGVAPMFDFWDSFTVTLDKYKELDSSLENVNGFINQVWSEARKKKLVKGKLNQNDASVLISQLDELSALMKADKIESIWKDTKEWDRVTKIGFVKFYKEILNPSKNGFKIAKSYKGLNSIRDEDREVWMSGKVLMIPSEYFKRLAEEVLDEDN